MRVDESVCARANLGVCVCVYARARMSFFTGNVRTCALCVWLVGGFWFVVVGFFLEGVFFFRA